MASLMVPTTPHSTAASHNDESDFQQIVKSGHLILSYTSCVFLCAMALFSVIKTVVSNGCGVFDLRVTGVSFPQRPELFVLLFSTIPTMLSVLARPITVTEADNALQHFLMSWGWCQARVVLDLITRTASLWHMIYWNNRAAIIAGVYFVYRHWKSRQNAAATASGTAESPLESAEFARLCKKAIPAVIYVISVILILPIVLQIKESSSSFTVETATTPANGPIRVVYCNVSSANLSFYVYFDYMALTCLPLVINVIQFYYLALQSDSKWRMPYRLRCYLVTFILLNIPMVVTTGCIIFYKKTNPQSLVHDPRMGNGILISLTAYHACFAIKPVVYTTGCNCICCGQEYLQTHPKMERIVVFWSTPQHKKKKDWEARHKVHKENTEVENALQAMV